MILGIQRIESLYSIYEDNASRPRSRGGVATFNGVEGVNGIPGDQPDDHLARFDDPLRTYPLAVSAIDRPHSGVSDPAAARIDPNRSDPVQRHSPSIENPLTA